MKKLSNAKIASAIKKLQKYYKDIAPENCWGISSDFMEYYIGTPDNYISKPCTPHWKLKQNNINITNTKEQVVKEPKILKKRGRKPKNVEEFEMPKNSFSAMDLTKKLKDFDFDPRLFVPYKSGSILDGIFSSVGGIMPSTNYIVIGDGGVGKTTLLLDYIGTLLMQDERRKMYFVSAEMEPVDMKPYGDRIDHINEIPTLYFTEIFAQDGEEPNIWSLIEEVFMSGQDIIVLDSLTTILEPIREQQKWSYRVAERKFIELMIRANRAHLTTFLIIQQVTKGGRFVGSNKLNHATTGMFEIRWTDKTQTNRVVKPMKNRRGTQYSEIMYGFSKDGQIVFDELALKRHLDAKMLSGVAEDFFDIDSFFKDESDPDIDEVFSNN